MSFLRTTSLLFLWLIAGSFVRKETTWTVLDKGLEYAELAAPVRSTHGDSKIAILRIDPKSYEFFLECTTVPHSLYNELLYT